MKSVRKSFSTQQGCLNSLLLSIILRPYRVLPSEKYKAVTLLLPLLLSPKEPLKTNIIKLLLFHGTDLTIGFKVKINKLKLCLYNET